ncbi:MAG: hypothetical protein IJL24_02830, partial [Treponema sp.]|nr:hypothetical protein [Treponema sp.]
TLRELLESANLKYRNQLMSVRYFQMSTLEMTLFLGKKFYNIISCLNSRVIFIRDKTLMRKFFFDCKELLADGGIVVLQLYNFDKFRASPKSILPELASARVRYKRTISKMSDGSFNFDSALEKNGKSMPVFEDAKIYPLKKAEIEDFSKEAGFKNVQFFSGYDGLAAYDDSDYLLAVIS